MQALGGGIEAGVDGPGPLLQVRREVLAELLGEHLLDQAALAQGQDVPGRKPIPAGLIFGSLN